MTMLGAALAVFFGVLLRSRLPRLYHPVFNDAGFAAASSDRFFLCIECRRPALRRPADARISRAPAALARQFGRCLGEPVRSANHAMARTLDRPVFLLCSLPVSRSLLGCEKAMRNMYEQPKYRPLVASSLWPDGKSARPWSRASWRAAPVPWPLPPVGAKATRAASDGTRASAPGGSHASAPLTIEAMRRGRERYDIYCAPCHSVSGDGDGMVVRRGFPAPASLFMRAAARDASDAHLFDVITNGYGVMYPFADRIGPQDRWAIVAYVRALQRSQHASMDDVPQAERRTLLGEAP
jgi:mono/diheme cytochrome c family protein